MAVQDGYGKSSGSESLVFAYDLKDTVNSFRGEPATNLVATIASYYGGNVSTSYANGQYQTNAIVINGTDNTVPSRNYSQFSGTTTDTNSQTYWTIQGNSVVNESNQTVSFSVYLKGSGTCHLATYNDQCCYQLGPEITLTNTWTRYSITKTISTFSDYHWVAVRGITTSTNVFISSAQWERNSHSTPFTTSSRSNTQGLLDLTGNSSVDLSNVSFDSNAQLTFDGTNDKITINCTGLGVNTYNSTTEFIIQLPYYSGGQRCIMSYRGNSGGDLYIGKGGNGIFSYYNSLSTAAYTVGYIADGAIAHVAVVCDAANNLIKHYINGSLAGSASRTGWISSNHTSFTLGYDPGGTNEYMDGKMYKFAHYNRVLTTTEISNNYLKYKRQYGLT